MIRVVVIGVTLSVAALAFLGFMLQLTGISGAVFCDLLVGRDFVALARVALLARAYLSNVHRNPHATKIAIYGAGKAGVQLANALHANDEYDCGLYR